MRQPTPQKWLSAGGEGSFQMQRLSGEGKGNFQMQRLTRQKWLSEVQVS